MGPGPLKALGFTPRQPAAVVAWQSTVTAVVGVVVGVPVGIVMACHLWTGRRSGVPVGIVIGRQLWTVFARNINAVPDPTVPAYPWFSSRLVLWFFPKLAAAIPGRIAAQTPTALVLRAE